MNKNQAKLAGQKRRARRVRAKMHGTEQRPRLTVHRTNANIYAPVINDDTHETICSASTLSPEFRETGKLVAERAQEKGVTEVVFDRSGFLYHGRIQALADGARNAGLKF